MKNQLVDLLDEINPDLTTENHEEVVIKGFMDRYDVTFDEAAEIFEETKKFLSLAAEDENKGVFIDQPLQIIDEMWHTFILHTKQYFNFCFTQFNRFIHHVPTPSEEKVKMEERLKIAPLEVLKESEEKISKQYSLIYDKYGPETLVKWYDTWANKYTPDYINAIKKA